MSVERSELNVERFAPRGAVFLSYASQDAEAAKRIADALRAAGVEVWFDQSELVGGDAWDAKIRKQIKECALLIPLISQNTQARTEGYFRLEWRLADQRTHLMAKGRPFLLPVVIDGTRDADAQVPDSFTEVQWTKAPGGAVPPAFAARVGKILQGEPAIANQRPAEPVTSGSPGRLAGRSRLVPTVLGLLVVAALAAWQPWKKAAPVQAGPKPAPAASPVSEARKLANQALELISDPNYTRESVWLADELCTRALALDVADGEVWAVGAYVSQAMQLNTYDVSDARLQKCRAQAERAVQLAPGSVFARVTVARNHYLTDVPAEAARLLRELAAEAPDNPYVWQNFSSISRQLDNEADVAEAIRRLRTINNRHALATALVVEVRDLRNRARYAEAEAIVDELLAGPPLRLAYYEKFNLLARSWHDPAAAEPFIGEIPMRYQQEPAFGAGIAQYWLRRRAPDRALQALARVPQDFLEEYAAREPKGYLAGWAHAQAGRPTAAQAEWRRALALVEDRLKTDLRDVRLMALKAQLLALTGQPEAARETWKLRVELSGPDSPPYIEQVLLYHAALKESEQAVAALLARWPATSPGRRTSPMWTLRFAPMVAALRDDPRVQKLIAEHLAFLDDLKRKSGIAVAAPTAKAGDKSAPADKSVAVLAFANLSSDKEQEYFSDGISEELLNVLAKVPGLKVTARTSAFHFKGKDTPIPEIAKQLGVAYVVEGSVRKSGDKVRITAQLIKAADGFHVWSDTFTRELKDIFAVQDEIAGLIAQNLQLKLGAENTSGDRSTNVEAWQLYLDGRRAWNHRTLEGYREAETLFQRTIDLDNRFARAYAALADVWQLRAIDENAGVFSRQWRTLPTAIKSRTLIDKALEIDPRCAEAYASLGMNLQLGWQDEPALQAYRRAIELNPNYATAHQWLGLALLGVGRMDETLSEVKQAAELDPLSHRILSDYAKALNLSGNPAEALVVSRRALAIQPGAVQAVLQEARALAMLGRPLEAVALVEGTNKQDITERRRPEALAILVMARQPEAIRRLIGDVDAMPASTAKFASLVALGRIDAAFAQVESIIIEDGWSNVEAAYGQLFEPIRNDVRFQQMIKTSGRAEYFYRAQAWRAAHLPVKSEAGKE